MLKTKVSQLHAAGSSKAPKMVIKSRDLNFIIIYYDYKVPISVLGDFFNIIYSNKVIGRIKISPKINLEE